MSGDAPVARFHYTITGHGPPVVPLPGGTLWIYSYRETIPGLAKRFTVVAVELPGQGNTTLKRHSFGYDLEAMSGALGSFMDAVGLPRASVVGHFWDGAVSLYFPPNTTASAPWPPRASRSHRRPGRLRHSRFAISSTGHDARRRIGNAFGACCLADKLRSPTPRTQETDPPGPGSGAVRGDAEPLDD